ncbi:MAG: XisI protein [Microcystis aeruginosa K13-05]|jgi:hypothetical protein|uniref:XisI protein n=1 Tax=Microcystis aeruginosa PCC 9717 TaxID=1160286 RepID=I4FVX9_MICAE|nr:MULTISPECIES: XisI protein [Microcystis]MDJ0529061.1 XisI protein [Microcystis sp. M53600_WE12]NCR79452.1 XisI protein [Microcystis aeruginosa K13-10]NCR84096.1 XisI protein [Microcystis aeruginosa K13-05]MCZ8049570.1 XisI protein [Microcystis sp. LE19-41.2A]MCZ8288249.1 XisI protein [Microcystis sp. LE19-59.1C]
MDKLAKYRQLVKSILSEYTQYKPTGNDLEIQAIFDEQKEHYQVVTFGWEGEKYVHYCLIHIDLKSDKIWIQWNMTEQDIAEDLVRLGVPKKDIVIGFHPPVLRQLTDYAVG